MGFIILAVETLHAFARWLAASADEVTSTTLIALFLSFFLTTRVVNS